jgi:hypothetical protein
VCRGFLLSRAPLVRESNHYRGGGGVVCLSESCSRVLSLVRVVSESVRFCAGGVGLVGRGALVIRGRVLRGVMMVVVD